MDEQQWLMSDDPRAMLEHLLGSHPPYTRHETASDRKMQLFACACVRQVCHLLTDQRSWRVVEVAEQYADKQATKEVLEETWAAANELVGRPYANLVHWVAPMFGNRLHDCVQQSLRVLHVVAGVDYRSSHAALARCIFGNPFRSQQDFRRLDRWREMLAWNGGLIWKMASGMYHSRSFDAAPILADACEEAGCDVTDLLAHLRGAEPHARGCWAIDLLLGLS